MQARLYIIDTVQHRPTPHRPTLSRHLFTFTLARPRSAHSSTRPTLFVFRSTFSVYPTFSLHAFTALFARGSTVPVAILMHLSTSRLHTPPSTHATTSSSSLSSLSCSFSALVRVVSAPSSLFLLSPLSRVLAIQDFFASSRLETCNYPTVPNYSRPFTASWPSQLPVTGDVHGAIAGTRTLCSLPAQHPEGL